MTSTSDSNPTPFIQKVIPCPVCKAESSYNAFKTRIFWNRKKDIDQQPLDYFWTIRSLSHYYPPLYYVWLCPSCHFASSYQHFRDPTEGTFLGLDKFRRCIEAARAEEASFDRIVEQLSADIDPDHMDFFRAIKLHLLAIHYMRHVEALATKETMNLARYFLRIAWLYRDLDSEERTSEKAAALPKLKTLFKELESDWPDAPTNEHDALTQAAAYYDIAFEQSNMLKNAVDEINVLQLTGRIHIKLNNYKEAQRLLQISIERARKNKMRVDEELKGFDQQDDEALEKKRAALISESRKMTALIDEAQKLFDTIRDEAQKQDLVRAQKLLKEAGQRPAEELRNLLAQNHISSSVINHLLPSKKKKGIFNIFK
jgi:uncharacterized protein (DUF2225 family)